jgi:L-asparaginase
MGVILKLRILAAGGTFDKHYDPIAGQLDFGGSHLPQMLERARVRIPFVIEQLRLLDSLDMRDADRQRVLESCIGAAESNIVIIHGTDTMRETAAVIGKSALDKTVVLTGSMIPYEIANSDALFNLGFACGIAQTLPHGVYVAMNGQVFAWDKVRKNRIQGVFESY